MKHLWCFFMVERNLKWKRKQTYRSNNFIYLYFVWFTSEQRKSVLLLPFLVTLALFMVSMALGVVYLVTWCPYQLSQGGSSFVCSMAVIMGATCIAGKYKLRFKWKPYHLNSFRIQNNKFQWAVNTAFQLILQQCVNWCWNWSFQVIWIYFVENNCWACSFPQYTNICVNYVNIFISFLLGLLFGTCQTYIVLSLFKFLRYGPDDTEENAADIELTDKLHDHDDPSTSY